MRVIAQVMFWLAVLLMVDAAVGLWTLHFWSTRMPGVNVRRIAFWEVGTAAVLLAGYYALVRWAGA